MSVKPFVVPDLGEGLEEVTLSSWNVAVGDEVELNQPLCSVETAKAEVEIPSPYAGRIVETHGAEGDVLPVGALLVRIDTASDAPSNGESPTRTPILVGYGADDTLDASRRPKAKPPVRKLAADLGVDLASVPPGPDGLVSREAVLAAAEPAEVTDDVLPVRGVQAEMARRMTLARSQIPDAHASVQVDCTNLLRLHEQLQVTPFALTLRFVVLALTHHRILNSTWVDEPDGPQVRTHRAVHLGFAVAAPRGLLVPVVADAQQMTTRQFAEAVARLTEQARAGTLKPALLQGSTFTVSNFGALGLDEGVPVINYPEAAILGMGSLKPRPMALDDSVVVRPQMTLTCVFDHRVADGAQVAAFLGELRGLLESPQTALLDL
ncbi:dihydrolipoamide acetyltransferase component of pyruvate dehydrogenase complex [Mycobacterium sp. MFM001]|uniref:dihydrolipoamide acetyltransferase family protein n=1 Tax=Mycobacterium sp. MFM001 TaxID=2049453 RepID=UPI000DA506F7|nr:dihydrolipoamide acetyltransferase family protein [Mycobacterium sp. MFM001]GBE65107.1 dihydrolipoamide acetyltransferase component of pyruvate dehydrogenase complex [Mycobacterium sp. MFM001]